MSESRSLQTVPVRDGHLAHLDLGSGRPVVLLHGGALDHRMWTPQLTSLTAAGYRVLAPDARGHGSSSTPTGPFRHCDDLADLLTGLDTGPVTLVGVSMGAGTAVDTAVEHPDLVRALVISGAGTSDPDWRDPWSVELVTTWARNAAERDADAWLETFLRLGNGPHRTLNDADPTMVTYLREQAGHTLRMHIPATGPVLPTPVEGVRERARGITVPLLAVSGGLDSDDHRRMPRELAEAVPDGSWVTVDGAAHYPNLERPAEFDRLVLEFLART